MQCVPWTVQVVLQCVLWLTTHIGVTVLVVSAALVDDVCRVCVGPSGLLVVSAALVDDVCRVCVGPSGPSCCFCCTCR